MIVTALLVRWMGGWHDVTDAGAVTRWGRKEAMLGLGAVEELSEVETVSREQLVTFGDPLTQISCDTFPVGEPDTPYVAYRPGDMVTVPDRAGLPPASERVQSIAVSMDDNGRVTYATELRNVLMDERERFAENLTKLANGSIGGYSKVAQPTNMTPSRDVRASLEPVKWVPEPWRVIAEQPTAMSVGHSDRLTQGPTGSGTYVITRAKVVFHGAFSGYVGAVRVASDISSDPGNFDTVGQFQIGSWLVPEQEYPIYLNVENEGDSYTVILGGGRSLYVYGQGSDGALVPPFTVTVEFGNTSGPTTLPWHAGRPPWWP